MSFPIIVLQTDFSLSWTAVGTMKGVIKTVEPRLEICDLCHEIRSFDAFEASLSLAAAEPYWPEGTIFVSVVDPGVGTARRASAARLADGRIVITPDNGTLTHMKYDPGIAEIRELDEDRCMFTRPGRSAVHVFHGRDLFGHAAALLASGKLSFQDLGSAYDPKEVVECPEYHLQPTLTNGRAEGFVMTGFVHFGGISFNICNEAFEAAGFTEGEDLRVRIFQSGECRFDETVRYDRSFGSVAVGAPILYKGSSGYLSLDLNSDHFMARTGVDFGMDWTAEITRE